MGEHEPSKPLPALIEIWYFATTGKWKYNHTLTAAELIELTRVGDKIPEHSWEVEALLRNRLKAKQHMPGLAGTWEGPMVVFIDGQPRLFLEHVSLDEIIAERVQVVFSAELRSRARRG